MQAPRGTFLQLPSVFIETCDLPETAQIMYIRMLHKFGYKNVFVGSIRKLANIVRMPKSTVDRMLDVLAEVNLLKREHTTSDDTERDILKISLDTEDLWQSNTEYCNNQVVPNWDKGKKKKRVAPKRDKVSQVGTNHSQIGTERPNVGQSVPNGVLKEGSNITKTSNTDNITKDVSTANAANVPPATLNALNGHKKQTKPQVKQPELPTPPAFIPVLTPQEQEVYDAWSSMKWFKGVPPKLQKNDREYLRVLVSYKPTPEIMYKVRNWAMSPTVDTKGWYKKTGWSLYGLAKELPKWLSMQPDEPTQSSSEQKPSQDENQEVLWTRHDLDFQGAAIDHWYLFEWMPLREARDKGYIDQFFAPSVINEIDDKLELYKAGKIQLPKEAYATVA